MHKLFVFFCALALVDVVHSCDWFAEIDQMCADAQQGEHTLEKDRAFIRCRLEAYAHRGIAEDESEAWTNILMRHLAERNDIARKKTASTMCAQPVVAHLVGTSRSRKK